MKNLLQIGLIILYFAVTHFIIKTIIDSLYKYIGIAREENKLTATLGILDRLIYALCFTLGYNAFIGIWLGVKIASRLTVYSEIKKPEEIKEIGEKKNIFLIGNITSLATGI